MTELIEPGSILDMTQDDLEALISTIRERRNRVIKARSVAHHRSRATGVLSLRPKLEKLALRLDKIINKLDADLARAERLVREVTAMRLELGDATPSELAEELRAAGTRNVSHGGEGDDDDDVSGSQEQDGEDQVSGSQSDHDDDQVSGSQERPHQGVT
jgi:CRP-like cAMP-binding protein